MRLVTRIVFILMLLTVVSVSAQPGPPPPDPSAPVPLTGIEFLVAGGALFGIRRLFRAGKAEN